jgi:hypothetical protein
MGTMFEILGPRKKVQGKTNYIEMNDESSSRSIKGYLDTEANNRMNGHEPNGGDDRDRGVSLY